MGEGFIAILIVLIVISLYLIFYRSINSFFSRILFPLRAYLKIYKIAHDYDYYLLNKVAIKVEGKVIHFDHILFGDKYIYCIVNRYYPVAVNGKFDDIKWLSYKRNNKFTTFSNPMRLNRERVNYFSSLIASSKDLVVGIVLVNDSCFVDEIDGASDYDLIVRRKNLAQVIRKFERNPNVQIIDPVALEKLVKDVYYKGVDN